MDKDIEFCRREYKRQKKLEIIVNSRSLYRPRTKKWQVVASFIILPFLLFLTIFGLSNIITFSLYKIITIICFVIFILESYLRFCLIQTVKCYQGYAKEETRKRCKCIPSCSEYTIMCLKTLYPLLYALIKIRKRLKVTCNGEEYKVDFPYKKDNKKFERTLLK